MRIGETHIEDTFAEAFRMRYVQLLVTAHDDYWLRAATTEFCGYGSSVIGCDAEVGVERWLAAEETPDGRPGVAILAFSFSADALAKAIPRRAGQCLMTCPTTAVFDGARDDGAAQAVPPAEIERIPLGRHIRFFGDGFQKSKSLAGRRYWRVPVMDGEFLVEDTLRVAKGIAGGNLILQGANLDDALSAARRSVEVLAGVPGVITPFPGGMARSGSKVGSRYKKLVASTADAYCPTLRGRVASQLHPQANFACEIVINGVDEAAVGQAMGAALRAAIGPGVVAIGAGNYGGKLGKFQFRLYDVLAER